MSASAIVLVARSAIAAAPMLEMQRLVEQCTAATTAQHVTCAFTEQGEPPLRAVVERLRTNGFAEIVLVPLLLPMEPSAVAFLTHTVQRWQRESPGGWPALRIGACSPAETDAMPAMLTELVARACATPAVGVPERVAPDGSIVPDITRRVLVCAGGPCNAIGASVVWGHLRNEQKRLNLRASGISSAKTTCLGPCKLAPVVQVYPEGAFYGGVNEADVDRIIAEHLLGGHVVAELTYAPSATKQSLRGRRQSGVPEAGDIAAT